MIFTAPRKIAGTQHRFLIDHHIIRAGAVVVFVNVSSDLSRTDANFLNVQRIG